MIRYALLFLVCLIYVTCQSVESDGSCNGPPTFNCIYGSESYSPNIASPKRENLSQGRPGKRGIKGEKGLTGIKGNKGEAALCDDVRKELERLTQAQTLLNQQLQNLKTQVQNLINFQEKASTTTTTTTTATNLQTFVAKDCQDLKTMGVQTSGVYNITVDRRIIEVYCDMESNGGGWTVIQRRTSSAVDFYRDWQPYKVGFGDVPNNFWLGLDNIHAITSSGSYQLRVDLQDFSNNQAYALYSSFSIGDESSNYRLHVSGYSGNAGDSLTWHNNRPFSTKDRDNDKWSSLNCAESRHGAWWYKNCAISNLNGIYYSNGVRDRKGVGWRHWKNYDQSLKRVEMKIKPN